jgi:hypothetical protein
MTGHLPNLVGMHAWVTKHHALHTKIARQFWIDMHALHAYQFFDACKHPIWLSRQSNGIVLISKQYILPV